MLRVVAGIAVIAGALAGSRFSESIDLFRFPIAWAGVILALDGAARMRHGGRSPIASIGDLLALCAASVVFWDVFELLDLRLQNWWYVGTSENPWARAGFGGLSFATVLPATRLFAAALAPYEDAVPAPRGSAGKLAAAGLAMLLISLAFPRYAFGFAWLFLWPLCEAALRLVPQSKGLPSPLLERAFAKRLLVLALPMGLLWEGLNRGCARGWVYTVPFFRHPKLFEMPLPGYLGYLPFFLECGAALALLDRLRPFLRGARGAAALAAVLALHFGIDRLCLSTTLSTEARLDQLHGHATEVHEAAASGVHTPRAYLATNPDGSLGDLSRLVERTRMGVPRAERYAALGIADLGTLAASDPADLARRTGDPEPIAALFIDKAKAALSR